MALKKGFLRNSITTDQLSQKRLIIGVLIGLFVSFVFYALQYTIREAVRFSSISDDFDIWVLSHSEVNFYNLVFAFISVIVGQSVCFLFWFDRPKKILGLRNTRLRSIINDQRALNWVFLSWFSKVATTYGILFGVAGIGGYYTMSFYPDYNYMFILIIMVLFLQTWATLLLVYKKKAQKWMVISAILVSTLSFGLSKINFIDYRSINESIEGRRLDVKYQLKLPESEIYTMASIYSRYSRMSLVHQKMNAIENEPLLFINGKPSTFEEIPERMISIKSNLEEYEPFRMSPRLHVHSEVKMKYVNKVKRELAKTDIALLKFAVVPKNSKINDKYYNHLEKTSFETVNQFHHLFDYQKAKERMNNYSNVVVIEIIKSKVLINGSLVESNDLKEIIQENILKNSDYGLELCYSEDTTFDVYFEALGTIKHAIVELRDEISLKKYGYKFSELRTVENQMEKEYHEIITRYPFRFLETTTDLP